MGNHPSSVVDDGQSSIHRQSYTVRGDLYARAVTASTINARVVYARRITCQKAQISHQEPLPPHNYPQPPHRSVTAHTLNVDAIYADEVNCKTLRAYDVYVGGGEQWRAKRVEWLDRNQVGWDGKEDEQSESSDNESDEERTTDEDRARRKKMLKFGAAGALGIAIGGAALAYSHHQKQEEEEKRKKEEELRLQQEKQQQQWQQQQHQQPHHEQQHYGHQGPPPQQQPMHHPPAPAPAHSSPEDHHQKAHAGNYHLSSKNSRLWSDGMYCYLIAECDAGSGRWQESRINLDERITNADGEFRWVRPGETGNFSGTAQKWEIVDGNIMVADLRKVDGSWHRHRFDLSEHITNDWGNLKYVN